MYKVCKKCRKAERVDCYLKDGQLVVPEYKDHCTFCGAESNHIVEIDDALVPIITGLWELGYLTMHCCAGHYGSCLDERTEQTYIMFWCVQKSYPSIRNLIDGLSSTKHPCHVDYDSKGRLTLEWHTTSPTEHYELLAKLSRGADRLTEHKNSTGNLDTVISLTETQNATSDYTDKFFEDVLLSKAFFKNNNWLAEQNIGFTFFYYDDESGDETCTSIAEIKRSKEHDGIIIQPHDSRFFPLLLLTYDEIREDMKNEHNHAKFETTATAHAIELMKWLAYGEPAITLKALDDKIKELGLSRTFTVSSVMGWLN